MNFDEDLDTCTRALCFSCSVCLAYDSILIREKTTTPNFSNVQISNFNFQVQYGAGCYLPWLNSICGTSNLKYFDVIFVVMFQKNETFWQRLECSWHGYFEKLSYMDKLTENFLASFPVFSKLLLLRLVPCD